MRCDDCDNCLTCVHPTDHDEGHMCHDFKPFECYDEVDPCEPEVPGFDECRQAEIDAGGF